MKSYPQTSVEPKAGWGVGGLWIMEMDDGGWGSIEPMDFFIDFDLGFLCFLLGHWVPSSNILT